MEFDDIYAAHDGLGPDWDYLDIEVEFEDDPAGDEPEKWPRWKTALVTVLAAVIVGAWFAALAGWLS